MQSARTLGVVVKRGFKFHDHIRGIVGKVSELAYSFLRVTVNKNPDFIASIVFYSHKAIVHVSAMLVFVEIQLC